jgi:hypothetical protein
MAVGPRYTESITIYPKGVHRWEGPSCPCNEKELHNDANDVVSRQQAQRI